jgi:hypothetical protein
MKRLVLALCLAMVGGSGLGLAAHPALAASLCVGSSPGCFGTIQAALNAAHDGDVIHLGPGTFAGGISITKSVKLVGAGAGATIIQGGGPVVTIGTVEATSEPTVSITGVTVTGGVNHSFPTSSDTRGGGIYVARSFGGGTLTTVTISNSVITGNTSGPVASIPCDSDATIPCFLCVPDPSMTCAFAGAGGIQTEGTLTITDSTVSHNTQVCDDTLVADGIADSSGGIGNGGVLTVHDSTVTGNTVRVTTAHTLNVLGLAGGVGSSSPLSLDGSTISNNTVMVTSTASDPNSGISGLGGGIVEGGTATVRDSVITGNQVTVTGSVGFAGATAGGIQDSGSIQLVGSTVSNNQVGSTITSALTSPFGQAQAGGLEIDGTASIQDSRFTGNRAIATGNAGLFADDGGTVALGGGIFNQSTSPVPIMGGIIRNNSAIASAASGSVFVGGGGLTNGGTLTLRGTTISGNTGTATGTSGAALGGGIFNSDFGNGPPTLTLIGTSIIHNSLTGSSGMVVQGGGVFTFAPITQTGSTIAQNSPDQCVGC